MIAMIFRTTMVLALTATPLLAQSTSLDELLSQPAASQPGEQAAFSRGAEAEILFQEAQGKYYRGDLAGAENSFTQLANQDAGDVQAWYFLGLSQLDQNKYAQAVDSFNQAIRLDPSLTEVYAARAKAHIGLKQYDQARSDIAVFERDPKWKAQAAYLNGQIYYAQGELQKAADSFEAARGPGGIEQESAEFYQGLTYLRMRDLVRARAIYREAGTGGVDRDPTVAAASRQLDDVLGGQQASPRPWDLQLTAGYEYDTNVLLLGSNVALPGQISGDEDGRFVLQPRGSYSLYRNPRMDAGVEANGYFTFQQDISAFDIASYQGGPYVNLKLTDNLFASARYGFNYIDFGHAKYLTRHLITPQLTLVHGQKGYTSAYYQYQNSAFEDQEGTPFDRDGNNHVIGIVQGITLPALMQEGKKSNLELTYRLTFQDTQGSEYYGYLHTLGVVYYTPLPLWGLRADVGATVTFEDYSNPSLFDDPIGRESRQDFEYILSVGLTKEVFKNASVRLDYAYTNRNSNVEFAGQTPFEYDRNVVGLRFIYSF